MCLTSDTLETFLDFCSELNIYKNPELVKLLTGPFIQLIMCLSNRFACVVSNDCLYAKAYKAMM